MQYQSAGTIEFLLDSSGNYYFMEMNTRIQVEHGITELITGQDLVKEQILVAAGDPLSFAQKDVEFRGHALECRINAEDPVTYVPSPGTIRHLNLPGGPGVRIDTFAYEGCVVSPYYDSLVAKLMTYGRDREESVARMRRALGELVIVGLPTSQAFHLRVLDDPAFVRGDVDATYLDGAGAALLSPAPRADLIRPLAIVAALLAEQQRARVPPKAESSETPRSPERLSAWVVEGLREGLRS